MQEGKVYNFYFYRYGLDTSGDSFLIWQKAEKDQVINIVGHEMNLKPVKSWLGSVERGMRKMILDCVCSKIVSTDLKFKYYLQQTLHFYQLQNYYSKKQEKGKVSVSKSSIKFSKA